MKTKKVGVIIKHLDSILNRINEGHIVIKNIDSRFQSKDTINIRNLEIQRDFFNSEERMGFHEWYVYCSYDGGHSAHKLLKDLSF